jgi:hypothetical protein
MTKMKYRITLFEYGILIIPILSIGEIIGLFKGLNVSLTEVSTSIWIKAFRDIVVFLFAFKAVLLVWEGRKLPRSSIFMYWILFGSLVVLIISMFYGQANLLLMFSLIRWLVPVTLPFAMFLVIGRLNRRKYGQFVIFVFMIHFILQLLQLLFTSRYGFSNIGLSIRNPGIFLVPNTAAGFSVVSYLTIREIAETSRNRFRLFRLVALLSVLMTASGTGMITFGVLLLTENRWLRSFAIFIIPVLVVGGLLFLNVLSVRGQNYVQMSLGTRFEVLISAFSSSGLFPENMGAGTNTAVLIESLKAASNGALIADSMLASVIFNLGNIGLLLFVPALLAALWSAFKMRTNRLFFQAVLTTILFSFTTIITESYALFFPLSVLLALSMKQMIYRRRLDPCSLPHGPPTDPQVRNSGIC